MLHQPSNYLSDDYVPPEWQKELAIPSTFECTKEVIPSIFAAYDERGLLAPERRTALALAIRRRTDRGPAATWWAEVVEKLPTGSPMSAETFLAAGIHTVVAHALLSGDPDAYLAKHEPPYWTSTTKTWRQRARTPQNGRSSALDPPIPEASYVTIPGMDRPVRRYDFSEIPRDEKGALCISQEIFVTGATDFLQFDGFNLIPFSALGGVLVDTIAEEDCNSDWVDSQTAPPVATAPLGNAQATSSAASDLAAVQAAIARASQDKRKEKGCPLEKGPTDTQPPVLSVPKPPPVADDVESNIAKVLSAPPETDYAIELYRHINAMEPDPSDEPSWSVALCKVQTQIVLSKEKKRSDPARLDSMALLLISKLDAAIDRLDVAKILIGAYVDAVDVRDRVTNEEFTTMLVDGKEADGLHTLAKLKAQRRKRDFVEFLELEHCLKQIQAVEVSVFGSLTHGGKDWEHYMKFLCKLVMTEGYGTAFVVRYDAAFRTERAAYGSRLVRSLLEASWNDPIFLRASTSHHAQQFRDWPTSSSAAGRTASSKSAQRTPTSHPKRPCNKFNDGSHAKGTPCRFDHVCSDCSSGTHRHGGADCTYRATEVAARVAKESAAAAARSAARQ